MIIGNPLRSRDNASEYTAKVMIDKKSLEVVWVEMNDMKKLEEEAARKLAQYRDLSDVMKSEYVVEKGELVRRPGGMAGPSTTLSKDQELEVMKKGLKAAKAKLSIADGEGVVINEGKEYYEVTIGIPPAAGVRGPDYTARVMFDKKGLEVVQILGGASSINLFE